MPGRRPARRAEGALPARGARAAHGRLHRHVRDFEALEPRRQRHQLPHRGAEPAHLVHHPAAGKRCERPGQRSVDAELSSPPPQQPISLPPARGPGKTKSTRRAHSNTHRCSTGPQAKLDHGLTAPSETDLCASGRSMLAGFMNHMCALRAHGNLTQPTKKRSSGFPKRPAATRADLIVRLARQPWFDKLTMVRSETSRAQPAGAASFRMPRPMQNATADCQTT
jgi:hypothetical protein